MLRAIVVEPNDYDYERFLSLVNWEQLGIKIEARLCDGESAVKSILQVWPNIVFTDICLSDMDGITLIQRVKKYALACDFFVMSRQRRFESARKALTLGVRDYWVKPLVQNEVLEALETWKECRGCAGEDDVNEYIWKTRLLLRNTFVDGLTTGDETQDLSVEVLNEKFQFSLRDGVFVAAIVVADGLDAEGNGEFITELVESIIAHFVPMCYEVIPFVQGSNRITFIFNYAEGHSLDTQLPEIETMVRDHLSKRNGADINYCIGIGRPEHHSQKLSKTLKTAKRSLCCGLLRGWNKVYRCDEMKFDKVDSGFILTPTLVSEMKCGAALMKIDVFSHALRSAYSAISANSDPMTIVDIYQVAVDIVTQACLEIGRGELAEKERLRILQQLGNQNTLSETIDTLLQWTGQQFDCCLQARRESRPVRDVKEYVAEHYTKTLTLKNVAKQMHMNASHLSVIFKKETGQTFSDYLTDYRMTVAKQILLESEMTVAAVGKAVGYEDNKYFRRIFTQNVGVKPSEYRLQHRQKTE